MQMQPERFRAIRKGLKLNQAELGKVLGLTLGWVNKMETGTKPIEPRTALAMLYLELRGVPDDGEQDGFIAIPRLDR